MREPFEQAVSRHGATVLRVCRAALGPGADADDAWSETFLSALRAWPDLSADCDVEAWLVRVAQRRVVDVLRARGRRAAPVAEVPESAGGPAGAPGGSGMPGSSGATTGSRSGAPSPPCRSGSAWPSPTTTSAGCHIPRRPP